MYLSPMSIFIATTQVFKAMDRLKTLVCNELRGHKYKLVEKHVIYFHCTHNGGYMTLSICNELRGHKYKLVEKHVIYFTFLCPLILIC